MSKPFIERLSLDNVNLKHIHENKQGAGLTVLKTSFLGQLGNNVKANLITLAFCIPIIVCAFLMQLNQVGIDTTNPYSGNIGIYPVINFAYSLGAYLDYTLAMKRAIYMMPFIIIAAVGLAGLFNVIKYYCWGFKIKVFKTFFLGIKNSYAPFAWVGMMLAVCFVLVTFVLNIFNVNTGLGMGLKIAAYAGTVLVCAFVLLLCVYVTTQASVFNLTLMEILKNSLLLGMRFMLQNSLILVAGLVSMVLPLLTFNSYVQIGAYVLFFLLGFSWTATVWTIYTHGIYYMMYSPEDAESKSKTAKAKSTVPAKSTAQSGNTKPQTVKTEGKIAKPEGQNATSEGSKSQSNKQGNKQHYRNPKKNKRN